MPVTMLGGDAGWQEAGQSRDGPVGQQSQGAGRRCGVSFFSRTLFGLHVQHTKSLVV